MASQNILTATDSNFEAEVMKSNVPVLVDFWAEWCGPCRAIAPTIDELSTEFQGQVKVAKMNVDENPQIPGQMGIRGIPTILMFKGGKLVDQLVGAHPKASISDMIKKHI